MYVASCYEFIVSDSLVAKRNNILNNKLVAHRGLPCDFPENSLAGFRAVLTAGAEFIETDVNMTADGIAVLSHDETLKRLTNHDLSITKSAYGLFKNIPAGFPSRFGDQFSHLRIATLTQFAHLLSDWPHVYCFIELKPVSIACFGHGFIDTVIDAINSIKMQSIIISFDFEALLYTRQKYHYPVGWVLPAWSEENRLKASQLAPDYLFIKTDKCPDAKEMFWQGDWQWAVYTVNNPEQYKKFLSYGVDLIETDCFNTFLPALNNVE